MTKGEYQYNRIAHLLNLSPEDTIPFSLLSHLLHLERVKGREAMDQQIRMLKGLL